MNRYRVPVPTVVLQVQRGFNPYVEQNTSQQNRISMRNVSEYTGITYELLQKILYYVLHSFLLNLSNIIFSLLAFLPRFI